MLIWDPRRLILYMANGNGNGTQKLLGEEKEDSLSLQFNAGICRKERNFNMGDPEEANYNLIYLKKWREGISLYVPVTCIHSLPLSVRQPPDS